ncbi:unnamed protein product [Albugo candida]|uniref:Uncharacterized protein n=1 Tax=Albugo candida TaxID=65357 RepID=A0A024FVI5_9STRA|nr:unnamed protein product [Albugo candida]|eukprot:CCI10674.1 unnamed protein product [Albugo candida]
MTSTKKPNKLVYRSRLELLIIISDQRIINSQRTDLIDFIRPIKWPSEPSKDNQRPINSTMFCVLIRYFSASFGCSFLLFATNVASISIRILSLCHYYCLISVCKLQLFPPEILKAVWSQ